MAAGTAGKTQPWFTIREDISTQVSASTDISVRRISAVAFDTDVMLTIGSLGTPFELPAYTPIGIDVATSTIQVDIAAFMFAMGN